jgi:hypothetical protein
MRTPLPELSITPIGVKDIADLGPAPIDLDDFAAAIEANTLNARAAEIADLVARWLAGGWSWHLEGAKAVTLSAVSNFDPRITHKFHFDRGVFEESEIVCDDRERGLYLVVAPPPTDNRDVAFSPAPLHRLADAMIAMDVVMPLGVAEKIGGDRISEVRS